MRTHTFTLLLLLLTGCEPAAEPLPHTLRAPIASPESALHDLPLLDHGPRTAGTGPWHFTWSMHTVGDFPPDPWLDNAVLESMALLPIYAAEHHLPAQSCREQRVRIHVIPRETLNDSARFPIADTMRIAGLFDATWLDSTSNDIFLAGPNAHWSTVAHELMHYFHDRNCWTVDDEPTAVAFAAWADQRRPRPTSAPPTSDLTAGRFAIELKSQRLFVVVETADDIRVGPVEEKRKQCKKRKRCRRSGN